MSMIDAIIRSNPIPVQTVELDGYEFILECDVDLMRKGIESLRELYDDADYGYQTYKGDISIDLTEKEFLDNIDEFEKEFEKRLEREYVTKVIKKAKKKKNGTFYKNRVYDEFVLRNARDTGMGKYNIYGVKYEVVDDTIIRLIFHYRTDWGAHTWN